MNKINVYKAGEFMEEYDERTLAEILEEINQKLNVVINEQQKMKKELRVTSKQIKQKLNKMQEYNEIDEMRNELLNKKMAGLVNKIIEIDKRIY
jgi:stage III sporulation protein SpoIIIAA